MNAARKIDRIGRALARLAVHESDCRLCPRECGVNREAGEVGFCGGGRDAAVSHSLLHYGEEPVLSGPADDGAASSRPTGRYGSGTIFFSGCSLKCRFCQNYQLSWLGHGREVGVAELAAVMLALQDKGALNINLVSPTHYLLAVLRALRIALDRGLFLPVVANSSGYEKASIVAHLEGIVDVYLPDLKYGDDANALACSNAPDYWATATAAISEMARQVGPLRLDEDGIAKNGLVVRHLVLPGGLAATRRVLEWIAEHLPAGTAVSLMGQYFPAGDAVGDPQLGRKLTAGEYAEACALLEEFPEIDGWTQDMERPGGC